MSSALIRWKAFRIYSENAIFFTRFRLLQVPMSFDSYRNHRSSMTTGNITPKTIIWTSSLLFSVGVYGKSEMQVCLANLNLISWVLAGVSLTYSAFLQVAVYQLHLDFASLIAVHRQWIPKVAVLISLLAAVSCWWSRTSL